MHRDKTLVKHYSKLFHFKICWKQDVSYFTKRSGRFKVAHHLLRWTMIDVYDVTGNVCGFQENMKEKSPHLADEF